MTGKSGSDKTRTDDWKWILIVLLIPIVAVILFFTIPLDVQDPFRVLHSSGKVTGKMNWAILLLAGIAAVLYIIERFMPESRRPLARSIRWFCIVLLVPLVLLGYFSESLKTLFGSITNAFNNLFGYNKDTLDDEFRRWFVVVTGAFLAIYPITFLAYRINVHPRLIKRLKNEIQFLGLEDSKSQNEELVDETFKSWHFWLFIIPIIAVSFVIVLGYLMPDLLPGNGDFERPMQLVFFSLLGAYVFSVQELVRRYQTNDLRPHVYATILVRIVIAAAITFAAAAIIDLAGAEVAAATPTATVTPTATATPTGTETPTATLTLTPTLTLTTILTATIGVEATADSLIVGVGEVEATQVAANEEATVESVNGTATAEATVDAGDENPENGEPGATSALTPETSDNNDPSVPASGAPAWAIVLAFLIGMIPARGTRWMSQRTSSVLGNEWPVTPVEPLRNLAGISQWHESRLLEMGIDDVQNLATANILELLLTTRFSAEQVINWIDQAILYTRIGPEKFVVFRSHGINTYSDLKSRLNRLPLPVSNSGGPSQAEILRGQLGLINEEVLYTLGNAAHYANFQLIQTYYRNRARYTEDSAADALAGLLGEEGPNALTPAERTARDLENLRYEETSLENSLESSPEDAVTLANLAAIRLNIGQVTADDAKKLQAITDSLQALAQNPALVDARITLGWAYHHLRRYDDAISACNVAIQWDASRKEPYLIRGLSRLDQAIPLADLALRNTLLENAKIDINMALELDDRYADAYFGRGRVLLELSSYQEAIESFETFNLLGDRELPNFWHAWGRTLQGMGRNIEARQKLDQALAIQPNNAGARYLRALTYLQPGILDPAQLGLVNLDPAIVDLREAILLGGLPPGQQGPAQASLYESLRRRANIRSNIGEWPAALADYKEMLNHSSDSAQPGLDAYIGNAFVYAAMLPSGTPDPAQAIYEWILINAPNSLYYGPALIAWEQRAGTTWPGW